MAWRVNEGAALDEMMFLVSRSSSNTDSKAIKLISFNDYNFIIISKKEIFTNIKHPQSSFPSSHSMSNEISWFYGQRLLGGDGDDSI